MASKEQPDLRPPERSLTNLDLLELTGFQLQHILSQSSGYSLGLTFSHSSGYQVP